MAKYTEWYDLQTLAKKVNFRQPFIDESLYEYRMSLHMCLLKVDIIAAFEVRFRKAQSEFTDDEVLAMYHADTQQQQEGKLLH